MTLCVLLMEVSMKLEIKERWIKALRSGEYKQGMGGLRNTEDEFCCLGVLCDVVKSDLGLKWDLIKDSGYYNISSYNECLPGIISNYTNISNYGELPNGDELTGYNDDRGYTFEQLADIIEKEL